MNIWGLLRNILPFVKPYKWLGAATLVLTLIGSLMAQVNAVVLDKAVDAIAQMFIKNPPIIFFDEPTASLDAIATEQIKASIDAIKKGRTVVIISHNIGQIIDADQIYVLQQGRVVQQGSPTDVYQQGGLYKDIFAQVPAV